ncbi:hypothetical protein TcasGA2_TC031675 [Tribolium castaneum]|uniref:Uncharacterized protein n=1 Tax=Tribolium castaneum TaxID=7070 RepID=A0A139W8N3_TRICA|nr:hypothetical protein TcasGA2_TC031675 [Tribolium castaneum]
MSGVIEDDRKKFKEHVKEMEQTVQTLENNLKESNQNEKELMLSVQNDQIKYQGISNQLKEALKENQQLINILQQKTNDQDTSRTNSQVDLSSSCSTMSIVHLQYKYEELLTNHHGLMKEKKNEKINKLKAHKETLQMVHNQLVNVLDNQCMEKDSVMSDEIKNCRDSEKALLLQEIRKNNMLAYENFQLNQQVELLQSVLRAQKKNAK